MSLERVIRQIIERFRVQVEAACEGSIVPPALIAAFISQEAGKDRSGTIVPEATRFEPGVYKDLTDLRDTGKCYVAGRLKNNYNGITRAHIADASNDAIAALSTSYQITQIMGWWVLAGQIKGWWPNERIQGTVAELRAPGRHLLYTVALMEGDSRIVSRIKKGDKASIKEIARIWNTGSPAGKTHHADYPENIYAAMKIYERLTKGGGGTRAVGLAGILSDEDMRAAQGESETAGASPALAREEQPAPVQEAQVQGDPAVQVNQLAEATAPIVSKPDDDPAKTSQGSKKSLWATISGGAMGALAWAQGTLNSDRLLIAIAIICLTLILLAFIFRQIIMDWLRGKMGGDPTKFNIK